jgi:glutathione synthase
VVAPPPIVEMKLLFVADPLESFKTYKDTTYAMMRSAQARGHAVHACEARELQWARGGHVVARVREIELIEPPPEAYDAHGHADWFRVRHDSGVKAPVPLMRFEAVVMRKDPPFDNEYFYATHLLEQAEREGAKVWNRPAALRNHPEKLAILEFPQFIAPTLVSRDAEALKAFHAEHHDVILKPLDGMGGAGIFRVGPDALNLGSIIETLNAFGRHTVMAQRYLPEIVEGDKRVLLIGGKVVPHALARIPQGSEIRGNLAAGGKGVAQPLTGRDRQIAEHLGPVLAARGLLLVGLDIIGSHLTEINVTSPTGFQEITKQAGFDVAATFLDALEAAVVAARA